ncbi:MAG: FG-GAP repeat protein [Candidatus Aminicenantes bacterium]|nr:MAG: FG-GAP repeat protein [Candidatus Aminicenantes bacterium]
MIKNMTFVVSVVFIVLLLVISTQQSFTADFNNDGYDDLAVGAPGEARVLSRIQVMSSSSMALPEVLMLFRDSTKPDLVLTKPGIILAHL